MGWLLSTSTGLVNLFECNAGGGVKGEPSLMVRGAGWAAAFQPRKP
jgi:hypothetical protein